MTTVLMTAPVCFFVVCNRHWFNTVPGLPFYSFYPPASAVTLTLAVPTYP